MRYAIIAAGEGSRLAQEGIVAPKPLVKIQDETLIDRLIRIFMANGGEEIDVICNGLTQLVAHHLERIQQQGLGGKAVSLKWIQKTTPSSMHSFYELSHVMGNGPFVLTTVDTIFRPQEFTTYMAAFGQALGEGYDGLMGVTDYVDDEKPLYVGTDDGMNITGFYDTTNPPCKYISGGIYGLTPRALQTLGRCIERGESRMRNFQRALVSEGQRLKAFCFSKVLDIDHKSDIQKAEDFLK
ncbi:MAG: NTP transferase domain-containing protein [Bacteroidales bacterium]|nr:NTP transferase domain-containing protein [Bacteroidales bacterium]